MHSVAFSNNRQTFGAFEVLKPAPEPGGRVYKLGSYSRYSTVPGPVSVCGSAGGVSEDSLLHLLLSSVSTIEHSWSAPERALKTLRGLALKIPTEGVLD